MEMEEAQKILGATRETSPEELEQVNILYYYFEILANDEVYWTIILVLLIKLV